MIMNLFTNEGKRYFDLYEEWSGSILERIQDTETLGEMKSRKERLIKEVKDHYFPKNYEKEIIKAIRNIYDNQKLRFNSVKVSR